MCSCPCVYEDAALISSQGLAELDTLSEYPADSEAVAARLSVARLTLTDFRCFRRQRLETDPRPVVLAGPNGAGKTNLLEAISFLVPGRGLRRARLRDVARCEAGAQRDGGGTAARAWAVAAQVLTPRGRVEIGTGCGDTAAPGGRSEKRAVRVNGQPARSQTVLAEYLSAQWLTPRMDKLFTEGASPRRRFLDRLVYGLDPAHAGRVSAYEHALRERARLLRRGGAGANRDPAWLSALEETMAANGVAVAAARRDAVARLDAVCADGAGPFPGAGIQVSGTVESWLDEGPALAAEERLRESLAASRDADGASGGAATGPHRSDLRVWHLARDRPAEQCSSGEQKALLIAVVLANARMQAAERGRVPLLLLDEVVAHLDRRHREGLFEEVSALGAQAWLTGTDAALFAPLRGTAQFFRVEDAQAVRVD